MLLLISTKPTLKDFLEEVMCQCVSCLPSPRHLSLMKWNRYVLSFPYKDTKSLDLGPP